jgi:hypothetical protein
VRVRDVISSPVACVPPDMRLKEVADLLVQGRVLSDQVADQRVVGGGTGTGRRRTARRPARPQPVPPARPTGVTAAGQRGVSRHGQQGREPGAKSVQDLDPQVPGADPDMDVAAAAAGAVDDHGRELAGQRQVAGRAGQVGQSGRTVGGGARGHQHTAQAFGVGGGGRPAGPAAGPGGCRCWNRISSALAHRVPPSRASSSGAPGVTWPVAGSRRSSSSSTPSVSAVARARAGARRYPVWLRPGYC